MTLRVTIEVIPHGDESNPRLIDVFNISNMGLDQARNLTEYVVERNEYKSFIEDAGDFVLYNRNKLEKLIKVYHRREDGAFPLIRSVLERFAG